MDIVELANELVYRVYVMDRVHLHTYFKNFNMKEYMALNRMNMIKNEFGIYEGKIYLKDLSEKLELTMRQTSKLAGELRDKGFVSWEHDGDGSEGTYLVITEAGENLLMKNQSMLKDYYGRVIDKYGKEKMLTLLHRLKELETVIQCEMEEMGYDYDE